MPWLLTGLESLCSEGYFTQTHGYVKESLFTFSTQVCTFFYHFTWIVSKIENVELLDYLGPLTEGQPQQPTSSLDAHAARGASQQKQQSPPVNPWSAHAPQVGQFPSPFPRYGHALSTNATASGVLFIFGGYAPSVVQNDLYVISTRDFSTTLLQTSGETPSPRQVPGVALTSTSLLVWGGMLSATDPYADSLYLLNLGMSDLLMSRPAPADQSFLPSSIARVDPRRGQWSRARLAYRLYHDFGWFQYLLLRWLVRCRSEVF